MPLVFAGVCSHAPGIIGRAHLADPAARDSFYAALGKMRETMEASAPDALIVIAAEHFGNFFMNNMPAFAMALTDHYEGPIEDEAWLGIRRRRIPGNRELALRLITRVMQEVDVAYAEEWKLDHGIMVPLHFLTPNYDLPLIAANINCQGPPLTPLHRAYAFGRALRRACDEMAERIAIVGTGGISHWPATPNSGKINEAWDRDFLARWSANRREELLAYTDEETYRQAGQGGFEIRTFIAVAGAAEGSTGEVLYYRPIPIFSVGCTAGVMRLGTAKATQDLSPAAA
jgi:2,3-dihydroxyphenylpropionate 1,2-dioxygenase